MMVFRIEDKKVSMGHFEQIEFGFHEHNFCRYRVEKGPTTVFPYVGWWYKYWSLLVSPHPHPYPHPWSEQQVYCQGANKLENIMFLMIFMLFIKKVKKVVDNTISRL